ncbi:hypothetical protein BZA05DRAFT_403135 [Tricharina praecox]|uniref:uncharacterized protein n=1 Tax=Tricharina praecox TaxID=43433 RepID=UPI0022205053|nr:uncharacterized protein BZA05DRAFT_403135 [Tricharina praecox]KAI5848917.1 hypothetical protein BZA05DRAFT_403135 [Tricharina praecox]
MGLASKMAAAKVQSAQPPGGAPAAASAYPGADSRPTYTGQQPPATYNPQKTGQAQYQAYQPQQQQAPPPQQQSYGQQQQQQYGGGQQAYPPQSYGAPAPPGAGALPPKKASPATDPEILFSILKETTTENNLGNFYDDNRLRQLAAQLGRTDPVTTICGRWDIPLEISFDLVKLALYDIVFLVDDSGSIEFSKLQGELKSLLRSAAFASSLFDQDGFSVKFLNSTVEGDNIRTEAQAEDLVNRVRFQGVTPLVTSLRDKILRKYLGEVHEQTPNIKKPLLVIIITDGMPTDSPGREFQRLIKDYKIKPVAFQIAQVGVDADAQDFLASLDSDPEVGGLIDCTSNFEMESAEFRRMTNMALTRELWYTKLLLGSIDRTYDKKDEKESGYAPPAPAKPSYGGSAPAAPPSQYYQAPGGGQQQYPPSYSQQPQAQQYGHQQYPQGQPGHGQQGHGPQSYNNPAQSSHSPAPRGQEYGYPPSSGQQYQQGYVPPPPAGYSAPPPQGQYYSGQQPPPGGRY